MIFLNQGSVVSVANRNRKDQKVSFFFNTITTLMICYELFQGNRKRSRQKFPTLELNFEHSRYKLDDGLSIIY